MGPNERQLDLLNACDADRKRAFGEALLLKFLVGELMKDTRARLHVFSKHEPSHSRSSLLQNSLLWRLLKAVRLYLHVRAKTCSRGENLSLCAKVMV